MLITLLFCHRFSSRPSATCCRARRLLCSLDTAARGDVLSLIWPSLETVALAQRGWAKEFGLLITRKSSLLIRKLFNFWGLCIFKWLLDYYEHIHHPLYVTSHVVTPLCIIQQIFHNFSLNLNTRRHFIHTHRRRLEEFLCVFVVIKGKNLLEGRWNDDDSSLRPFQSTFMWYYKNKTKRKHTAESGFIYLNLIPHVMCVWTEEVSLQPWKSEH